MKCEYCEGEKCLVFDDVDRGLVVDAFIKQGELALYFEDAKEHLFVRELRRPIWYCPICGRKLK